MAAISDIIRAARPGDVAEIRALVTPDQLLYSAPFWWQSAAFKQVFRDGLVPVAFATFHPISPTTLQASLVATELWPRVTRKFFLWGLRFFKPHALKKGFKRVECRTLAGNDPAIDMLEALGFRCEATVADYGRNGEVFLQYAWRLSDHVRVLSPQSPEDAGAAEAPPEGRRGSQP